MTARALATFGDFMHLGEFARWLEVSTVTAAATLTDQAISYVRIGPRGQYRISTASVAEAFGVPLTNDAPAENRSAVIEVSTRQEGSRHGAA